MKEQKKEKENLEQLKQNLEKCQREKEEYLAGWQRARADFLNYKKEEIKRIKEILNYANEELILKILPILDNIYIAETKIPAKLKEDQWVKGILQIKNQLQDFLKNQGTEEIKTEDQKFDPAFHEAIETVNKEKKENSKESGKVIKEIQKGYILKGKVIRPAKVKVAK